MIIQHYHGFATHVAKEAGIRLVGCCVRSTEAGASPRRIEIERFMAARPFLCSERAFLALCGSRGDAPTLVSRRGEQEILSGERNLPGMRCLELRTTRQDKSELQGKGGEKRK
jgi:hypothetical protein